MQTVKGWEKVRRLPGLFYAEPPISVGSSDMA